MQEKSVSHLSWIKHPINFFKNNNEGLFLMFASSPLALEPETLYCPITSEFYFDPVDTPCRHTFEELALNEWFVRNNHEESCACPVCDHPFKWSEVRPANLITKDLIETTLMQQPDLLSERYFHIEFLANRSSFSNTPRLNKIIQVLHVRDHLNKLWVFENKNNVSALYQLLSHREGIIALCHDVLLVEMIDQDTLNVKVVDAVGRSEDSALRRLVESEHGLALLEATPALCDKITAAGLNEPDADGLSVLCRLLMHPLGLKILDRDARLRGLMLNQELNRVLTHARYKNYTPGQYLLSTSHGRKFIEKYPDLMDRILLAEAKSQPTEYSQHIMLFSHPPLQAMNILEPSVEPVRRRCPCVIL